MHFIPDIDLILGGSEEKQRAACTILEQNPRMLAEWRAHEWMLTSAASFSIEPDSAIGALHEQTN